MAAAMDSDQGDPSGADLLQRFTVPDGDEPVARAMDDVGMAFHTGDPFVGAKVKTQNDPHG